MYGNENEMKDLTLTYSVHSGLFYIASYVCKELSI